jgi:hypothetical protein
MRLPEGTNIGDFLAFHEGNHNSGGNPHNQYNIPVFALPNSQGFQGQWVKFFSYNFSKNSQLYTEIEIWSTGQFATRTRGHLEMDIQVFGSGTVDIQLIYENRNRVNGNVINQFKGFYTANADGTYTIDVYMFLASNGETIKFSPIAFTFNRNVGWTAYNETYVRRDIPCFTIGSPIVQTAMDGLYSVAGVYNGVRGQATIYPTTTLPTASSSYRNCILTVYGFSNQTDKVYICQQKSDATFEWIRVPYAKSGTVNFSGTGAWTSVTVAHGLGSIPSYYTVTEANAIAGNAEIAYVTADATFLTINFRTAPVSGTNNVTVTWRAEV